jgi:hypothetical protein
MGPFSSGLEGPIPLSYFMPPNYPVFSLVALVQKDHDITWTVCWKRSGGRVCNCGKGDPCTSHVLCSRKDFRLILTFIAHWRKWTPFPSISAVFERFLHAKDTKAGGVGRLGPRSSRGLTGIHEKVPASHASERAVWLAGQTRGLRRFDMDD